MFDVGFGELLLIGVVALLVIGPERLPGAARTAGRIIGKLRSNWANVRAEVERELGAEELKKQVNDAVMQGRNAAENLSEEARRHFDDIVEGADLRNGEKTTADEPQEESSAGGEPHDEPVGQDAPESNPKADDVGIGRSAPAGASAQEATGQAEDRDHEH